MEGARANVARALALDPALAEAHAMLGFVRFAGDYDWAGAEAEFRRAIELDPNNGDAYDTYGLLLAAQGRYDEALAVQRRAHELDPLAHRLDAATTLLRAGRFEEAIRHVIRVVELEPEFVNARATLGWAYLLSGMPAEGIAQLERAAALAPESTLLLSQLGQAYGRVGRHGEAREILARLEAMSRQRYVSPYHLAYVYTGLGEQERAMDWLERAYEERAGGVYGIKASFLFTALRGHPRFTALLRKMNLAEPERVERT